MCLILFAHRLRADLPLLLLANRDEFLDRATAPLAPWEDLPEVVGGRDLVAGGGWLAAAGDGRWAAVTNVREGERPRSGAPSRGWLVRDYLRKRQTPAAFLATATARFPAHDGFNLLLGAPGEVWFASNRAATPLQLAPGLYGLSNGALDTPWPKVQRGKTALATLVAAPAPTIEEGFRLLADRETFADHHLPATGIPRAWERTLSATFIVAPERGYGTRSSTALLQTGDGRSVLVERSFAGTPERWGQRSITLPCLGENPARCRTREKSS